MRTLVGVFVFQGSSFTNCCNEMLITEDVSDLGNRMEALFSR